MPVITIARTFAAGGTPVGRDLARRFDAEFLDRNIVAAVAERSGVGEREAEGYDERLPGIWQRVAAALATSPTELVVPPMPADMLVSGAGVQERLAALTEAVIHEAAERGNAVIVGRGAGFIVGRRADAVHVLIHAPLDVRVRFLLSRVEEIPADTRPDEQSLAALCRAVDARRAEYVRRHFGVDWLKATNYDLAIDTGCCSLETAADLIEMAVRRHQPEVTGLPEPAARPSA